MTQANREAALRLSYEKKWCGVAGGSAGWVPAEGKSRGQGSNACARRNAMVWRAREEGRWDEREGAEANRD